ncbi:hypothetical protein NDU88_012362 [Pleurodeles waltl]|uniref:Uncharacterized protein n=1 Tax=Pleurodeles waltl TaxID=8319 RepID=A0AAV7R3M6_PLEWA|nr:hypothetical protein NDU88_012362 [Pleurodeles waltl]
MVRCPSPFSDGYRKKRRHSLAAPGPGRPCPRTCFRLPVSLPRRDRGGSCGPTALPVKDGVVSILQLLTRFLFGSRGSAHFNTQKASNLTHVAPKRSPPALSLCIYKPRPPCSLFCSRTCLMATAEVRHTMALEGS